MENIKENQNVKELNDEQLKEVSGGRMKQIALGFCHPIPDGCEKPDADCNCIECGCGYVLVSGKCSLISQMSFDENW